MLAESLNGWDPFSPTPNGGGQGPRQGTCHKNALCSLIPSNCDNLGPSADLPPHCSPLFQIIKACIQLHRPALGTNLPVTPTASWENDPSSLFSASMSGFCCAFPGGMGRFPSQGYARCVSQDPSHPGHNQGWNFYMSLWGGAGAAAVLASFTAVLQGLCCLCQGCAMQLFQRHGRGLWRSFWSAMRLFAGSCAAPATWDRQNLERKNINSKTRVTARLGN